jgi:hypothetical protein
LVLDCVLAADPGKRPLPLHHQKLSGHVTDGWGGHAEAAEVYASATFKALQALVFRLKMQLSAQSTSKIMWALAVMQQLTPPIAEFLAGERHHKLEEEPKLLDNAQFFWALGELRYLPEVRCVVALDSGLGCTQAIVLNNLT